jgi:hypothetical protein
LESHVEWSVVFCEFQGYAENGTLVAVISFSRTRRNHRGPSEASKEDGSSLAVKNCSTDKAVYIGTLL